MLCHTRQALAITTCYFLLMSEAHMRMFLITAFVQVIRREP